MVKCRMCDLIKKSSEISLYEDEYVYAFLSNSQQTYGKSIVALKQHKTNFMELDKKTRDAFMDGVVKVAKLLQKSLKPVHMNYEILGNYQPHIHCHIVPRYSNRKKDAFYNINLKNLNKKSAYKKDPFFAKYRLEPVISGHLAVKYKKTDEELKKIKRKII
ncbi:MAG: HIT family protein [Candidatus Nanoarchaeia archaeon]|nr:HIT family protein [Candidatus Nanoarchaeia archaeon]